MGDGSNICVKFANLFNGWEFILFDSSGKFKGLISSWKSTV
jgi:hypothetical protein